MFRYNEQALSASRDLMLTACRELNEYEEEVHVLLSMLNRNPEIPAPRRRLRKSLENLEQRETSLNLTRRKLDAVCRLYENTENRIRDMADETEGINSRGTDDSVQRPEDNERSDFGTGYLPFPEMNWVWPPLHPVGPRIKPGFRPGPFRPRRPLILFPPGRPRAIDPDFIRRSLYYLLHGSKGHMPAPRLEIPYREREFVLLPYVRQYGIREVRQARLHSLFGTDRA